MSLQFTDTQKYQAWVKQFQDLTANFIDPEKEKIEKMVLRKTVEIATPLHKAMKELENLPEDASARDRFFAMRKFLMAKQDAKDVTDRLAVFNV